jgi:hypothetical protein
MDERRPSLADLRLRLAGFEQAFDLCDYIDHWPDVLRCREFNQLQIDRLRAEIARRESEDDERAPHPATLWPAGMGDTE